MATNNPNRAWRRTAVWVLALDSGGCGACTQQIYGLLAPRYAAELRAQGISLARGPRHADVILITGALTEAAREPLRRLLADVPEPRALVAVGDCAIGGCVFRGSPVVRADAAEALDVNIEIAGCPPNPKAILEAIGEAGQLLASARLLDDAEEAEDRDDEDADDEAASDVAATGDEQGDRP